MKILPAAMTAVFLFVSFGSIGSATAARVAASPPSSRAGALRARASALKLSDPSRSAALYDRAAALDASPADRFSDLNCEAGELIQAGYASFLVSKYADAVDIWNHARTLYLTTGNRDGLANALNNVGNAYDSLSQFDKADRYFNQALPIYLSVGDGHGQAIVLNGIGVADNGRSRYVEAIATFNQALPLYRRAGDDDGAATALGNIGEAYDYLSQYARAIDYYNRALTIFEEIGDTYTAGQSLTGIGFAYGCLSQYAKSIDCYNRAFSLFRSMGSIDGEAISLDNIGFAYVELGQYSRALAYSSRATPMFRAVGDRDGQAWSLGNIGYAYAHLNHYDKAMDYYNQALPIVRSIGDRNGIAQGLTVIGDTYEHLGKYSKAIAYYNQALPISRTVGDIDDEAETLHSMLIAYRDQAGSPRLAPVAAIVLGKQAVNILQQMRSEISHMDTGVQRSFVKSKDSTYRDLADILIAQGRLPEAEQVLGMLKEQQYFDFIGQDRAAANELDATVAFTPEEQKWLDSYSQLGDTVENLQAMVDRLARTGKQSAPEYKHAQAQLALANSAFSAFLAQLPNRFTDVGKGQEIASTLQDSAAIEDLLTAAQAEPWRLRVCAIYTVEADSQYDVVLVTPNGQKAGAYPITAAALNANVERFREALADPNVDPRPLAHQLYDIVLGPVEKDIDSYNPDLVMWSLDGPLSLVPVSALWDGNEYLVQRWQSALFNAASIPTLGASQEHNFSGAIGMGVSKGRDVGSDHFPDLGGVPDELKGIFDDPSHGSTGPVPGTYMIDGEFKTSAVLDQLQAGGHGLVHIATHFKLDPAGSSSSYLLTGDGVLTLSDLAASGRVFRGVDLLTLSACATAVGDRNALDATAQLLGAHAILATLWDVADPSTAAFMKQFYQLLAAPSAGGTTITLAAAVRDAQLSLLGQPAAGESPPAGKMQAETTPGTAPAVSRGSAALPTRSSVELPPFTPDPAHPYAHPYYWAPFVLLGNWK